MLPKWPKYFDVILCYSLEKSTLQQPKFVHLTSVFSNNLSLLPFPKVLDLKLPKCRLNDEEIQRVLDLRPPFCLLVSMDNRSKFVSESGNFRVRISSEPAVLMSNMMSSTVPLGILFMYVVWFFLICFLSFRVFSLLFVFPLKRHMENNRCFRTDFC